MKKILLLSLLMATVACSQNSSPAPSANISNSHKEKNCYLIAMASSGFFYSMAMSANPKADEQRAAELVLRKMQQEGADPEIIAKMKRKNYFSYDFWYDANIKPAEKYDAQGKRMYFSHMAKGFDDEGNKGQKAIDFLGE